MNTLTKRDWSEIYYALESKLKSPFVEDDPEWKSHLQHILDTIGPDGEDAAAEGVFDNV